MARNNGQIDDSVMRHPRLSRVLAIEGRQRKNENNTFHAPGTKVQEADLVVHDTDLPNPVSGLEDGSSS